MHGHLEELDKQPNQEQGHEKGDDVGKEVPPKMEPMISVFVLKSRGPGCNPWMIRPPSRMEVTRSPGIPKVLMGMSAPPQTALLAVSEATTPSS
jgi:hypothetical protein